MKSRTGVLTALVLCVGTLVGLGTPPASAAVYPVRVSQAKPMTNEVVRVYGVLNPARRVVVLQRAVRGRWLRVATSRTVSGGRYAFNVRALPTSYAYRVVAPRAKVGRRTYALASSRLVRIAGTRPVLTLRISPARVGQTQSGTRDLTPVTATFSPARPGAQVALQKLVNGRWAAATSPVRQNSAGQATFQAPGITAAQPGTFRAYTRPNLRLPYSFATPTQPQVWAKSWSDEFAGDALDASKWLTRNQQAGGRRRCSTPGDGLVSVARSVASLRIKKVGAATKECPNGTFKNAMIAANGPQGFAGKYGVYAARIKFQAARGMHGSFWLQGPPVTGDEIDVAEYFGDGRRDGGLSSFVHHTAADGALASSGGIRSVGSVLGSGRTPSSGWHVYSVEWSPTGYVFRLDGVPTLTTDRPHVSTAPEELILSMLSSDYELPYLRTTASTMDVDWVRVWQE